MSAGTDTRGGAPAPGGRRPEASPDPVDAYVAALADSLHGPRRAKSRLVAEVRDGLDDAVSAHTCAGVPYERAARLAVRDFGSPDHLVPVFQRELSIAQARHTARAAAFAVPLAVACWLLVRAAGHDGAGWQLPRTTSLLTAHLTVVAAVVSLLAAATLAATGRLARRLPTPRRLPLAVAWTGTAASVAMAATALVLAVLSAVVTDWPPAVAAGVLAAASHAVVASSARSCRRCARLPVS
ncbi:MULTISPECIES: permease prefix domain 1-containing protein [Streptomyces]|uniref:Permease prefix domain 1-containing protein n=1 Tax=Streptomyces sudanensis TaxID=436397 RepID=A0ABY4TC47_9ACTN|nr:MULTISPECIES: permease prefix domain 1-containing protein [Streptomyces]MCP9987658.1 permease prefix domain 1-containing protein [Streptomyces sudanensis]URN16533.1 permease prefix domain 1-containing protein [Streptomyces sudanensis]